MVIIFGEPNIYLNYTVQDLDFEACVDYCNYILDTCMAVYNPPGSTECRVFGMGQLASVTEMDVGGKVGIRMTSTDSTTCPLNPEENSMTNAGSTMPQYTITLDNGIWKFPPIPICQSNFALFSRPKGLWCIGVILTSPTFVTKSQAISRCAADYEGNLSGLENVDEYNYVVGTVLSIIEQGPPELFPLVAAGFWVDGDRKSTCKIGAAASCNGTNEFTFTDPLLSTNPTGYIWGDMQPSGRGSDNSNCVYAQFNATQYATMGIDDYTCELAVSLTNLTVFAGYVCGMQPTYLS